MRQLHYAGESLFVSFDICTAVFDYARALASARKSDVVTIPIYIDGKRDFSNVLLGPSTTLFCTPGPEVEIDLDDADAVAWMKVRTANLGPTRALVSNDPIEASAYDYE